MHDFLLPPVLHNENGDLRTVGFEFEFGGPTLAEAASLIVDLFGGRHVEVRRYVHRVADTPYGDFRLEIDFSLLKQEAYVPYLAEIGIDAKEAAWSDAFEDILEGVATTVIPYEISTPPIPITALAAVETLRATLQAHQAEGTKASLIHAFGMHINPEAPALDAATLLSYLRAFLLLYDWLVDVSHIDLSRRVTPYIDAFPTAYAQRVLDPDYAPDHPALVADYLAHNPTRNRPLDLLPLFAYLDEAQVRRRVGSGALVKPRPTFHYRLPNCLIDEEDWRVATEWNRWVDVEKLAQDRFQVAALSSRYRETVDTPFPMKAWIDEVKRWMP